VPESAFSACSAAPLPRPPQPTKPILMVLLPEAWTSGALKPEATVPAAAIPAKPAVEPVKNSRRLETSPELEGGVLIDGCAG
jgi:hypothetical protein